MSENEIKLELNEKDMDKISAGKSLNAVLTELLSLAPQYPEILEIFNAYKKGDSIGRRFGKKEKANYAELMTEDYVPNENYVDEFDDMK